MIIFDLDGTLADCDHRRHFVDPEKNANFHLTTIYRNKINGRVQDHDSERWIHINEPGVEFQSDWKAFYEACDEDKPIMPVFSLLKVLAQYSEVRIWSGRDESVREKTISWLMNKCPAQTRYWNKCTWDYILKMRPKGDSTPDDVLKEKWLDETLKDGKQISFVFDDGPKVVRMWQSRGIFVFNCCQHSEEF